jgi:ABC-2 type transport system permease protein
VSGVAVVAAFIRRDFRIDISYRLSFGLDAGSAIFSLALFFYLSRVIDQRSFSAEQGLSGGYFAFAAVGVAVLTMVNTTLSSFSRKLREEQTTGTFEALVAAPASTSLIALSSGAYDVIRATFDSLLILVAAVVVFGLDLELGPGSLVTAALALIGTVVLLASLGVAVAAFTVVFKRASALLGLVSTSLALMAGVYFPVEVLPSPLEQIAEALPFTWGLDALRDSLLGGDVDPAKLAGLFASAALLLPPALWGFNLAVRRARQTGTLSQY